MTPEKAYQFAIQKQEQEITITKLHTCRVCGNKWIADLEKTTCPKCNEKEIIIRNA